MSPAVLYRLEKLDEANDKVLRREIVEEDYLRYLPEDLREPVEQYNADTSVLKNNYSQHAAQIAASLLYEHGKDPGDYQRGDLFYAMTDRISTLALYRNAELLCRNDPILSYTLAKESGGSFGIWAYMLNKQTAVGEDTYRLLQDYFDSVDALLDKFDAARTAPTAEAKD